MGARTEYNRAWRQKNRERLRTYEREYKLAHREEARQRARERRQEHLAEFRTRGRAWYQAHREQEWQKARLWRQTHPEEVRARNAAWSAGHREERRLEAVNLRRTRKQIVIEAYGGKCACCGETDWEFLTIDHINGGGQAHKKELGGSGQAVYQWLIKNNFPKDRFRLLCLNCNFAFGQYGYCPHQLGRRLEWAERRGRLLRAALGG